MVKEGVPSRESKRDVKVKKLRSKKPPKAANRKSIMKEYDELVKDDVRSIRSQGLLDPFENQ